MVNSDKKLSYAKSIQGQTPPVHVQRNIKICTKKLFLSVSKINRINVLEAHLVLLHLSLEHLVVSSQRLDVVLHELLSVSQPREQRLQRVLELA